MSSTVADPASTVATAAPAPDRDAASVIAPTLSLDPWGYRAEIVWTAGAEPEGDVEVRLDGRPVAIVDGTPDPAAVSDLLLETNQIADAGFSEGLHHFALHAPRGRGPEPLVGVNLAPMWSCGAGNTAFLRAASHRRGPTRLTYVCPVDGEMIAMGGERPIVAQAAIAAHRGTAELLLEAFDRDREPLQRAVTRAAPADGGRSLAAYAHTVATVRPSRDLAFVRFSLLFHSNAKDGYLFFLRPLLSVSASHSGPSYRPARFGPALTAALRRVGGDAIARPVSLPPRVLDGEGHQISAVMRATGRALTGSPIVQQSIAPVRGGLDGLDGTTLTGWVTGDPERGLAVRLLVNGEAAGESLAEAGPGDDRLRFRLPVPPRHCDGEVAVLTVVELSDGRPFAEAVEVVPRLATPFEILQLYAPPPLPATLSPAAARRYRSLEAWTAALGDAEEIAPWSLAMARQAGAVHARLVEGYETRKRFPPFALPQVDEPVVSIVIPVHGKMAMTYNCLAAIAFAFTRIPYEVIVSDDGSPDGTPGLADIVAHLRMTRSETAQGFGEACTAGANAARGQKILFLNNDTEPTAFWLDELMFAFQNFHHVGVAGAKLLYPTGRLQEAGGIVWGSGNPWNFGRGDNAATPAYNYTRDADYVSGAALMVDRAVWDQVGGFSQEFRPAYFEDTDLCFKVREAGYRTLYVPGAEVFHFEGVSNGTVTTGEGLKRFQEVNRPKFKRKWVADYKDNGVEGRDVLIAKDRFVQLRGLVVDLETPQPDRDAGSYAAIQEMRLMEALGCKLTFVPSNFAYLAGATDALNRLGIETLYAPFVSSYEQALALYGPTLDFIYVTRYLAAEEIVPVARRLAPHAKIIFNNADMHFLRHLRSAMATGDEEMLSLAASVRDSELAMSRATDLTLSYNPTEHAIIQSHNLTASKVALCPWVVDEVPEGPPFEARRGLAFLGSFGHPPNREAMLFFAREVMPLVRERVPEATLHVYGSGMTDEIRALASDAVVVEGFAETVGDVYRSARIFVAPLLSGAGVKGKVIEALAYGVPCILSPIAHEATGAREGVDAAVASRPQEYAEWVARLYHDEAAWTAMARSAQARARELYSFDRARVLMREAFEAVGLFVPDEPNALVSTRARL